MLRISTHGLLKARLHWSSLSLGARPGGPRTLILPRHFSSSSSSSASQRPSLAFAAIGPTAAGLAFVGSVTIFAAVRYNERVHSAAQELRGRLEWVRGRVSDWTQLEKLKRRTEIRRTQDRIQDMTFLPPVVRNVLTEVAIQWAQVSEGQKTLGVLIGINVLVFAAWQIPMLRPFMHRHFTHTPGSGKSYTLLTSAFSHQELWHLGFNMVGLYSFGKAVHHILGTEQFLSFYLSSAILSGLASHHMKLLLRNTRPLVPSLGASGALFGLLGLSAYLFPETHVSLIFLPMIPISISTAVPAMMALDTAGILLRWSRFDHMAHLSGALTGYAYGKWGEDEWVALQRKLTQARVRLAAYQGNSK